ncbi:hypothetical protein ACFSGX_13935 [Sphingomonas arantia]|uniref:DUF3168 domain-containing protein n=1 Tax=Sphingomonas arantia TaxID=1460676 RepID=A0ABW4TYQ7_9SPHN
MSGVLIAGELLTGFEPLTTLVPVDQLKAWVLPQGTPVPSLVATCISRTKVQFLAAESVWLMTERVQLTARAASGLARAAILRAAERACADRTGTIAGFDQVAVLFAGAGPDFMNDAADIFMGSIDLRISFNEPA